MGKVYSIEEAWKSFRQQVLDGFILEEGDEDTARSLRLVFISGATAMHRVLTGNRTEDQLEYTDCEMVEFEREISRFCRTNLDSGREVK